MSLMIKQYLVISFLLLLSGPVLAAPPLTTADWEDVSQTAHQRHSPILVVFSAETCGYCERLKREIIDPLEKQQAGEAPLLIREFDINAGGKLKDFNGEPIRSRQFKRRYHIFATPTLLIVDPDGNPLSDPIVGYNSAEEYQELLHASLVSSFEALK
jgi:thioredoxin-related protein